MPPHTTLLVMAKSPQPGRVKTRLCPPCEPEEAAAIAAAALADTLEAVVRCAAGRRVLALDGESGPWLPSGFEVVPQLGTTFTERLAAAWAGVRGPVVQIGMDTPQVTPALLDRALADVVEHGSVLGPASDGGWWAIGMDAPAPDVFAGVSMSAPTTGAEQLRAMRRHGLSPRLLPTLRDIDTIDDAREVAALVPGSRTGDRVAAVLGVHR